MSGRVAIDRPGLLAALLWLALLLVCPVSHGVDLNKLLRSPEQGGLGLANVIGKLSEAQSMDLQKEQQVGQQFAATLLGSAPLLNDPGIQSYVNQLGRWISLQTDRANQPWHFAVLDTPTVNAFATPGGYLFITRGMLERLHNETELAGVLAHEIGHVILQHHVKALQQGAFLDLGASLLQQKIGSDNPELNRRLANAVRNLYSKGLDKGDEYEADLVGVVFAARAGYDPYGLPSVLQTLEAATATDDTFSLMFKTHPPPQQRLARLLPLMEPLTQYAGATDLNADFSALQTISATAAPLQPLPSGKAADPLVQAIQSELGRLGYYSGPADGRMGNNTSAAIVAYQRANRLLEDGQASQALLGHLRGQAGGFSGMAPAPQASAMTPNQMNPQFNPLVHQLQVELTNRGFNPGQVTGFVTPQTGIAIVNYQQAHGLAIDGQASPQLLNHMRSMPIRNLQQPVTQQPANPAAGAAGAIVNELFKNIGR